MTEKSVAMKRSSSMEQVNGTSLILSSSSKRLSDMMARLVTLTLPGAALDRNEIKEP